MHKFIGRTLLTWSVFSLFPPAGAEVHAEPAKTAEAAPAFDLLMLQVDGNTVLDQQLIEKTVYPFLGPGKSIADVEKARQTLEEVYRKNGYPTVVVEIPEQDVVNDSVRLQVVEGTVERLKISGSRYYALGKIRTGVPALAAGQVPHMPEVQQQLAALNQEAPDRQVTPVFRAGATPGKTEVELRVKDEVPLHGSLEVNGRNPENTTRTRLIGSLRYDNLWQRFHSASLQYQVSPENYDEVEVWSGTYVLPTGWADTRLALYGIGISSNVQTGTTVGGLTVVGSGSIYGARLVKPFGLQENITQSLTLGFDYKNFNQGVTLQGQDMEPTPVTYPAFQIGYDGSLRQDGAITTLGVAGNFSIRGLGNNQMEFESRRQDAPTNYAYLTGNLKHLRALFWDFRLAARAAGQLSYSPLISNEQFSAGGQQSVRGYFQTQQLGDDGVNLSLELQSPMLKRQGWDAVDNLRLHAFMDYAYLWIQKPLEGNPDYYRLAGAGLGLRAQLFRHLTGELDWAYPLYRQGTVDVGNQRIDFRFAYEF
ncbi:ShlB/FhaC/HecB family hemolysin secretion/activation protein [Methylomicrobium lacus]|uniref:ShlB/FhaC/HecB family hemolysin secretion/activation protein n=1 Tax=Methylomicrobium lacus TaxID=136992 RepID=UPI0035A86663